MFHPNTDVKANLKLLTRTELRSILQYFIFHADFWKVGVGGGGRGGGGGDKNTYNIGNLFWQQKAV